MFTFFVPIVVNLFHIFYPNPLFSFEMEILNSQKGKPQLALDGFLYVIDKNDKKIYWKCVRNPECRGRAISNKKDDGQPSDACQTKDHNHAPSREDFMFYSVLYLNSYIELYVAKQKHSTVILYFRLYWSLI